MSFLVGVLLGIGLTIVWFAVRARTRALSAQEGEPAAAAMQSALHAAVTTLPHLRRGLNSVTAERAVPHLRALTGAAAVALADTQRVLAIDGEGREQVRPGDLLPGLLGLTPDDRPHVVPRLVSSDPTCPLHSAALAPLRIGERRVGTLIAFYRATGRPSGAELRVLGEAASLVSAQVTLSVLEEQEERLAQAELRALRAQISPHFIYNALAAVAGYIHSRPEEARELLTDFAEFTRYLFRDARPYVILGDELEHVQRYLRLERARFQEGLDVAYDIAPEVLDAVVPMLSLQPLVENAVRHAIEPRRGSGHITISARAVGGDVELRVRDDGRGMPAEQIPLALAGTGGGIGLSNVDKRLRASFGERYALRIDSAAGQGTEAIMTVPLMLGAPRAPSAIGAP